MDVIIEQTYTADEFETLPFDGNHYELVDGRIIEKMSPGDEHGWISRNIFRELTLFDPHEKLGSMWPSTSFKLSENTTPIPDLAFVVKARIPNPRSKKAVQVVPDFVVEVWSPGDLQSKGATEAAIIKISLPYTKLKEANK